MFSCVGQCGAKPVDLGTIPSDNFLCRIAAQPSERIEPEPVEAVEGKTRQAVRAPRGEAIAFVLVERVVQCGDRVLVGFGDEGPVKAVAPSFLDAVDIKA